MPSTLIRNVADKCGFTEEKVEQWWETAKNELKARGMSENDQDFWPSLTAIVKNRAGVECGRRFGEKDDLGGIEHGDPNKVHGSRASNAILTALLREMVSKEHGVHLEGY